MIPLLITVDLEEFDIPEEYGQSLDWATKCAITNEGLARLFSVFKKYNVKATFFTTGAYALSNTEGVQKIAKIHEIASHALEHSRFKREDYAESKKVLEQISGQIIQGFRMPRLRPVDYNLLKNNGYTYDASLNPTWLPGRYNKLAEPKTPFFNQYVHILPSSVTPLFRIPLFWLSFKNLPLWINKWLFRRIQRNGLFVFYIHPWEFADISRFQLPFYVKKVNGIELTDKLDAFLNYISKKGEFKTCWEYFLQNKMKQ
ncbi:MAG: polysaccharide deacetylase family protein [Saprospiraceae bacterium]|nr:polysaccharide deacetylase family protein [Saprospiraceae bacterium]